MRLPASWSPDGTELYFSTRDLAIARVTMARQDSVPVVGEVVRLFQLPTGLWAESALIDIAPDERSVASVEFMQLSSGEPLVRIQNRQWLLDR